MVEKISLSENPPNEYFKISNATLLEHFACADIKNIKCSSLLNLTIL